MTTPTDQIADPAPISDDAPVPATDDPTSDEPTAGDPSADEAHPSVRWWGRPRAIEAAASAAFTLYVVWPFLSLSQYVTTYDTAAYSGPHLAFTFRELRAGHLPTWNDSIFNGVPHLANAQTAPLSPLKFLFLGVEVGRALELITATNLILLAVGAWFLFSRRLRLRPPAGFIGTVAVIGSGLVMVRATQFEQIAVIAWLPGLLVTVDYAAEQSRIRPRAIAAIAAVTAMMCIAGHPNQIYVGLPFVALWAGARVADHAGADLMGLVKRAATVGLGALLGVGVAAAQLLVMAGQLSASVNTSGRNLLGASITGLNLTPSFIPSALVGQTWSPDPASSSGSFESAGFVGLTVCLLALLGIGVTLVTKRARWTGVAMVIATVTGVLLSLGPECQLDSNQARICDPGGRLYRTFFDSVPGFAQARVPGRWLLLTTLALAILAAFAVDGLVRRAVRGPALAIGTGLAVACGAAVLFRPVETNDDLGATKAVWIVAGVLTVAAIAGLAASAVANASRRGTWNRIGVVSLSVLVVLVVVELGGAQRNSAARGSLTDTSFSQAGGSTEAFLHDRPERNLSLTGTPFDDYTYIGDSLRPNANLTFGSRSLDGYDGGLWVTRRWVNAVDPLTHDIFNNDLPLTWQIEVPPNRELLARFGVRYIIIDAAGTARVYGVPNPDSPEGNAAGAALITKGYTGPVLVDGSFQVWENPLYTTEGGVYFETLPVAQDPDTLIRKLGDVTPSQALVPLDGPALTCNQPCPRQGVDLERPRPGQINAQVDLAQPGLFVVPEQHATGWTATVDGAPADIITVDSVSQGVMLDAGHHSIELHYTAPGLKVGLLVSFLSVVLVGLLAWEPRRLWDRIRRRRRAPISTSG